MTRMLAIGVLAVVMIVAVTAGTPLSQTGGSSPAVTKADYERWKVDLSNWGRWGKDDQLGALNLITPAKRKQAAALVKDGVSVSLARDAALEKSPSGTAPYERIMQVGPTGAIDRLAISFHGSVVTHVDSLAHRIFDGKMYNGFSFEEFVTKENGAAKNSIHNLKNGIFTRGILMDIPRLKGVPYLEPLTRIYPEDLEAWEKKAGVRVSAGDALFIRVGRWARMAKVGPSTDGPVLLDASVLPWLKKRDVAVLGWEQADQVARGELPALVVHDFAPIVLGVHVFDVCDLEAVAEAAAARKRWEFLLTAAPLPVPGGAGSPHNPIATF